MPAGVSLYQGGVSLCQVCLCACRGVSVSGWGVSVPAGVSLYQGGVSLYQVCLCACRGVSVSGWGVRCASVPADVPLGLRVCLCWPVYFSLWLCACHNYMYIWLRATIVLCSCGMV